MKIRLIQTLVSLSIVGCVGGGGQELIDEEISFGSPIEDDVVYESVTGAAWNVIPRISANEATLVNLTSVSKGVILVNAYYDEKNVSGNGGRWGGAGLKIEYRKGRDGPMRECSQNHDRSYKIWGAKFWTSVDCMVVVDDAGSDYGLRITPRSIGRGPVGYYEARYLLITTEE